MRLFSDNLCGTMVYRSLGTYNNINTKHYVHYIQHKYAYKNRGKPGGQSLVLLKLTNPQSFLRGEFCADLISSPNFEIVVFLYIFRANTIFPFL